MKQTADIAAGESARNEHRHICFRFHGVWMVMYKVGILGRGRAISSFVYRNSGPDCPASIVMTKIYCLPS